MKKKLKVKKLNWITIILIIIIAFSVFQIIIWLLENNKTSNLMEEVNENVKEIIINDKKILDIDFDKLLEINDDIKAYIDIDNTKVSYPVTQKQDNDYYLYKSLDKKYSDAGWIFADYKNEIDGLDKNLVIYGHDRKDNSMFGSLDAYLEETFYNENKIIEFITPTTFYEYEIYSVYTIDVEEYYITTNFTDETYLEFLDIVSKRSIYEVDGSLDINTKTITLSTCYEGEEKRLVIHGKLIDEINLED